MLILTRHKSNNAFLLEALNILVSEHFYHLSEHLESGETESVRESEERELTCAEMM